MVLAVCGGSPGEKDELNPGCGVNSACEAKDKDTVGADEFEGMSGDVSARSNTCAAADSALQASRVVYNHV